MNRIALLLILCISFTQAQTKDEQMLRKIYNEALSNGKSYEWLQHLSLTIGHRLSGSVNAELAVNYTKNELKSIKGVNSWLQPVMVPKWVRGLPELAYIETKTGMTTTVPRLALGGSVATAASGIKAELIEVKSIEDLQKLDPSQVSGKIVFYNRPMQDELINTFESYGGCVDQRYAGALEAGKLGAIGVIVRSVTLANDDYPHTGSMSYGDLPVSKRIPAAAISTNGANLLSSILSLNPKTKFYFKQNSQVLEDVESHNVIAEIKGSQYPDEIILVGGHLDSWDVGDGSHDDGAGVVQSMEVIRLFTELGYTPKRTIRVVLFMNEENGLRGATKYAEEAKRKNEKHILALESDAGGFTPRGFSFDTNQANYDHITQWKSLFEPYYIHLFDRKGSGADVGPLKDGKVVLAGLRPDSQRYFDHHHSERDTFDAVNKRELELGAATMAALVYLIDTYGIQE